jgi:16S rRNA (adenine1518-N6/adenine1519-N6)-dimethyltransferase
LPLILIKDGYVPSGIRARKRLGQHFLKDRSFAMRLVGAMRLEETDRVLEIGPGEGVLTELLLESPAKTIYAIEIDRRLCQLLNTKFRGETRFHLIEGDFLRFDVPSVAGKGHTLRIVGNLPYYITSPILFHALENRFWVHDMIATVQKEVGDRITSPAGKKAYGVPSVLFQTYCDVKTLFSISRRAFSPVPQVDSVALHITFRRKPRYPILDEEVYKKVVKRTFNQRRKMLRNTLGMLIKNKSKLNGLSIDLARRPESLSVSEFVSLSNQIAKIM